MNRPITFFALMVLFAFSSCGKEQEQPGPYAPSTPSVSSVSLSITEITTLPLAEFTITANVLPDNASGTAVTWTSSDETMATVQNGKVKVQDKPGRVVITARAGTVEASCNVDIRFPAEEDFASRLEIVHSGPSLAIPYLKGYTGLIGVQWGDGSVTWAHQEDEHFYGSDESHTVIIQSQSAAGCDIQGLEGIMSIDFSKF